MTNEIIVGVYESQHEAERAHAQLLEEGISDRQIARRDGIDARGERAAGSARSDGERSEDGIAAFIGRMLSGAMLDEDKLARYGAALRGGKTLIAVRTRTDAESNVAAAILAPSSPRVYPLPNAPTGWNAAAANDPASIGARNDPARPDGLLHDAGGLPAGDDEARLAGWSRARRNR